MNRPSIRLASLATLVALSFSAFHSAAQQQVPAAPAQAPSAPAPVAVQPLPKPDPSNFTASLPTQETVNAFLQANWGFDDSRTWEVWAVAKTPVDGISKVAILVSDKTGKQKPSLMSFFALPDGKHIIFGDELIPFGAHPFAESRVMVQQRADGPYRGSVSKDLEIVEFADFQCPHCKEAQANMEKLLVDFPKAHIVFENYPLPQHPAAAGAAAYGVCVAKLGGSDAFFTFAAAVFDGQDGLATTDGATLTLNSAVTKAGLTPEKVAACAALPETKATIAASVKLAQDLVVNQTPTLVVNGRQVTATAPYDTLKKIIEYQAKSDGALR